MTAAERLHALLHEHAATIEPVPDLAALGAGLTAVEHRRPRAVVVGTTVVVVVATVAFATARTLDGRTRTVDTEPAAQIVASSDLDGAGMPADPPATIAAATPPPAAVAVAVPPPAEPSHDAPAAATPAAIGPAEPAAAAAPAGERMLTFNATSVSNVSAGNPPAADYFGTAPPGVEVTASSPYGTVTTRAGADGRWSLHLVLAGAPVGRQFKVVLSAPPLDPLSFNFTHLAH